MPSHTEVQTEDLDRLMAGTHWNPRSILGPHRSTIDGAP
jgi:1,4-alpha-glucan branching enzyme